MLGISISSFPTPSQSVSTYEFREEKKAKKKKKKAKANSGESEGWIRQPQDHKWFYSEAGFFFLQLLFLRFFFFFKLSTCGSTFFYDLGKRFIQAFGQFLTPFFFIHLFLMLQNKNKM